MHDPEWEEFKKIPLVKEFMEHFEIPLVENEETHGEELW